MDKPDRAEGRQHLRGGLDAGPASGSRLDLRYAPGRSSRRTEIQVRTGNKVLRCQSQRRPGGLPRARGRRRAPPGGKPETASEPPPEPPSRSKGGAWSAGLAHRPGPKRGLDVPLASQGQCAPACGVAAMCPGRLEGPGPRDVPYHLRACGSAGGAGSSKRCQEADGPAAEELAGPGRKAPGKRKHVEASAAEGRPRGQAPAASAWAQEARPRWYHPGEAALRRRRPEDTGHPLKRTYGETSVGDRLGRGPASEGPASQDSDDARVGGPQRRARPRARPRAAPWFPFPPPAPPPPPPPPPPPRQKRRRTVLLADAQTQTEPAPGSCRCRCEGGGPGPSSPSPSPSPSSPSRSSSSSSRPSTSGQARSGRRAGRSSSQSSCREEEEEEEEGEGEGDGDSGSSSRGSSRTSAGEAGDSGGASTPSSGSCSGRDGRRAALEAPGVDSAPGRPGPPRGRRRLPATLGGQPRRRRSSSPQAHAAAARQPRRSQDTWGCLIF